ncbi:M23 family metallopeptidase [Streptomyces sp. WI04-05B]|uniref:M23 family metallopeptidase n=1 Tax=Streptomyces TaxID=1883 RepID=UPI0029A9D729|nr:MULTISPECIES: M23 family metallopeptidase [unclassified Streptomyces]MDX2548518.1 M23 family metallopeptidase [Streptomyces sp. WI04-05B]MDX2582622.1 M23 family metallopeptidase [Streptomyces sp. WI04-05A]
MSDDNAVGTPPHETPTAVRQIGTTQDVADPPEREQPVERPRRRGPGFFTLMVLPCLVTLSAVAGLLALTGGLPGDGPSDADPQQSAGGGVNETYGPWLRRAAACSVVAPSVLAAQIDQLTGWRDDTGELSGEQGIAGFTAAQWRTWGRDDDGNGTASPHDEADAIMALGRQDCSLARKITDLRTEGTVNGELVDLTLAAYAVGIHEVTAAGRVPAGARAYLAEVRELLPRYEAFDREPPTGGGPASAILAAPVSTLVVTSPYGSRQHPLTGVTKLHTGVDFGAPQGAEVHAARQGRVVFAAMTRAYGNRVVIDHGTIEGKRLETTYSHLSVLGVTAGQAVSAGDVIGRVGSTGLSTGPHLHFEVIYDGYYADPQPWLAAPG